MLKRESMILLMLLLLFPLVSSSLSLKVSISGNDWSNNLAEMQIKAGDKGSLFISAQNNLNQTENTSIYLKVQNNLDNSKCSDFEKVIIRNFNEILWNSSLNSTICSGTNSFIILKFPLNLEPLQEKNYEIIIYPRLDILTQNYTINITSSSQDNPIIYLKIDQPMFYTTSKQRLLLNHPGPYEINKIKNNETLIFWTENFPTQLNFYKPILNFYVKANLTNGTGQKTLRLNFLYRDIFGRIKKICISDLNISVKKGDWQKLNINCNQTITPLLVKKFGYQFQNPYSQNQEQIEFEIQAGPLTKVQINH